MKKNNYTRKDCEDPKVVERILVQNNFKVERCGSGHNKSVNPDTGEVLVFGNRNHSTGIKGGTCIFKILVKWGLISGSIFFLVTKLISSYGSPFGM